MCQYIAMKVVFVIVVLFFIQICNGQDIDQKVSAFEQRWKTNPLHMNGSFGLNTSYYSSSNANTYQIPFNYNVFGNIQLDLLGIQIPLSLFYTGKNVRYSLPAYHFVGLSPSYKQYTLHVGDRTMELGPYTMNNTGYTGVGAEAKWNKLHLKVMYGRLQKASILDVNTHNNLNSTYKRLGYGAGLDWKLKSTLIGVNFFHAWDDINSLPINNTDSVKPKENSIVGMKLEQKIGKILFKSDYAYNVLSSNARLPEISSSKTLFDIIPSLHDKNNSTGIYHAFKCGLSIPILKSTFGLDYERINPGYESLGSLFFNNDLETFASSLRFPLLKNKLQSQLKFGLQRNNLKNSRINSFYRFTTFANIGYRLSSNSNISLFFNNFQFDQKSYINPTPFLDVDTIIITQNNMNVGLNYSNQINPKYAFVFTGNYNKSGSKKDNVIQSNASINQILTNVMLSGKYDHGINAAVTFTYSKLNYALGTTSTLGPSFQISKDWIPEVWSSSGSISYFFGKVNEGNNSIGRINLSNTFTVKKQIKTSVQIMALSNKQPQSRTNDFFASLGLIYTMDKINLIKSFKKDK